jgi:sporulation integral membrane protein YlbJ
MAKRLFPALMLLCGMALLLLHAETAAAAARDALSLCAASVVPALFPFLVLSGLFISLGYADAVGAAFAPVTGRLLGCSEAGAAAFFLGILGGYPVGGRAVGELCRSGRCPRAEGERLLTCCNNAGPAFILGVVGGGCFHDLRAALALYVIHVTAALLTGILFRRRGRPAAPAAPLPPPRRSPAAELVRAVGEASAAMVSVCGFVVFFLVLLRLLTALTGLRHPLLLGAVELTSGVLSLPATARGFVQAAALLGWGGLSVHCQTAAVLRGAGLSLRPYLGAKALHAALSAALALPAAAVLFAH